MHPGHSYAQLRLKILCSRLILCAIPPESVNGGLLGICCFGQHGQRWPFLLIIRRLIVLAMWSRKISRSSLACNMARATAICIVAAVVRPPWTSTPMQVAAQLRQMPPSTDCIDTRLELPGRKFSCAERDVVATMNFYPAAGCAESDKYLSISIPAGCVATGNATSTSSGKYETAAMNSLSPPTAVMTAQAPLWQPRQEPVGHVRLWTRSGWSRPALRVQAPPCLRVQAPPGLQAPLCLRVQAAPWSAWNCPCWSTWFTCWSEGGPYPKVQHFRHCGVERRKLTYHDSGTAALRMAV